MKIALNIVIIFFLLLSVQAQEYATVIYKAKLLDAEFLKNNSSKNKEANEFVKNLLLESADFLKQSNFELKIINNEANFSIVNSLAGSNEYVSKFAYAIINADGLIYTNLQTKQVLHQMVAFDNPVILVSTLDEQQWNYTNETKEISGYTCFKAKLKDERSNITAWYSPKITLPFGPAGYGGLPGLILELEVQNEFSPYIYYVTTINIKSDNKIEISKPNKGKLVTKEQLDEMGEKAKSNFNLLKGNN